MIMDLVVARALKFWKFLIERCTAKANLVGHILLAGTTRTFAMLVYALATQIINRAEEKLQQCGIPSPERLIDNFEKAKWAFCPPSLKLDMDTSLEDGAFILPYCRRKPVNENGGTA
ncbi:hypothetical protein K469DRAFT_692087 [Zopfia rhizophila CBS 207.26]|uniref:Uncharacterized protein n=1 Tax=Zopfia rhizophila CBS 207.26 TaxID=1314779 RepID=A0A6A6DSK7_9PEZI|nr:hypothetical protein K469DRAFT_692087 [Zopfia rhizophila CBS 207.26]